MKEDVICYHNDSTHAGTTKMPNLLIRNVPIKTMAALKARAKRNNRSVQSEIWEILDNTVKADDAEASFWELAAKIRAKQKYNPKSDVTKLIREDRDR
ncbi:MAG: hypothetical protein K2Y22_14705 [Candidatus Obscuribacterales bacterium]|nr:hypothetical protein [Candidatus Obscuribacterales bacterium]